MALSGATTPGQSGPGSNGSEGVLRIPQSSRITGSSPSDYLVPYQDTRWKGVLPLCRETVGVFYSSRWLGKAIEGRISSRKPVAFLCCSYLVVFSQCFFRFQLVKPYRNTDTDSAWKKSCFILLKRLYLHMVDNLSVATYVFYRCPLTSFPSMRYSCQGMWTGLLISLTPRLVIR